MPDSTRDCFRVADPSSTRTSTKDVVMSEPNDSNASDAASRIDDLVSAIRRALAPDAPSEARASAANACRVILRSLEPAGTRNGAPIAAPASTLAGTPLGTALGALSSIPRDQILEFLVTGLRAVLSQTAPMYRARPAPIPRPKAEAEP
jgi:hypothetical protein